MLDNAQQDVLTEVINTGVGEAAAALAALVEKRVQLSAPEVQLTRPEEVAPSINEQLLAKGIYIAQHFEGEVEGSAVLVYTEECSLDLVSALHGGLKTTALTSTAQATLQEVGNIILSSTLSVFADVLDARLQSTVPEVSIEAARDYFASLLAGYSELETVISIKTRLTIADLEISGYLLLFLSFGDFGRIVDAARAKWLS